MKLKDGSLFSQAANVTENWVSVHRMLACRSGGAIVNISSIHSTAAFEGCEAYDAAEGGVDALTRNTAVE